MARVPSVENATELFYPKFNATSSLQLIAKTLLILLVQQTLNE
jgi:hypothetical protein